jgi:hypothetical protein
VAARSSATPADVSGAPSTTLPARWSVLRRPPSSKRPSEIASAIVVSVRKMERPGIEPVTSGLQSSPRPCRLGRGRRGFAARAGFSSLILPGLPGLVGYLRRPRAGYARDEYVVGSEYSLFCRGDPWRGLRLSAAVDHPYQAPPELRCGAPPLTGKRTGRFARRLAKEVDSEPSDVLVTLPVCCQLRLRT